jgi:hypothetical protein
MNTATRLGVYGVGLAVVFGGAFVAADAVVPDSIVANWTEEARGHEMSTSTTGHGAEPGHGGHTSTAQTGTETPVPGVTSAQGGYLLSPVTAPRAVGEAGELSFQILEANGEAMTGFATSHGKNLHLIVVRTDGTQFRHVHPTMAADGTWSLPWDWAAAGTYRVYADFVPEGDADAGTLTLTRTVEVAGELTPAPAAPNDTASVDGFTVELTGDLVAGASSHLTLSVSKDGEPVTNLQPYLGAFGHLVALREGDLAYLHVHPEGEEPAAGELSGPEIEFVAEAPTPGRYLLYLDFQVDGKVHSAPFVVDTDRTVSPATEHDDHTDSDQGSGSDTHSEPESGDGHSH